jgi:hypothetical protein
MLGIFLVGLPSVAFADRLTIQSVPSAALYLNGVSKGKTPLTLPLPAGRYHLELRRRGMLTWTTTLQMPSKTDITMRVRLEASEGDASAQGNDDNTPRPNLREPLPQAPKEPLPESSGLLIANSTPNGAKVYREGQLLGRTPLLVNLDAGNHTLRFAMEGYASIEKQVMIRPAISSKLMIRFQGAGGRKAVEGGDTGLQEDGQGSQTQLVILSNPPGAKVVLNGRDMGYTPIVSAGLPVGMYDLRVLQDGYAPYTRRFKLAEGQQFRIKVLLVPKGKK